MKSRFLLVTLIGLLISATSWGQCGDSIPLNNWVEEGNTANGTWNVSANNYSVTQTVNSNPSFFVSPDEYINVKLKGSFTVTGNNDDDFIGFVFGYQDPTAPVTNNLDFYLFDWKRANQGGNGGAQAGFTLSKATNMNVNWGAQGTYAPQFWGHVNNPGVFDVIATEYTPANGGNGYPWNFNQTYNFELVYTSTSIISSIDNDTIFNENGCFEPGRFGFYNYSQENVTYSDFTYELHADFDASEYQYCQGDTSSFAIFRSVCSNNTGSITNWSWDLGDGTTSTDSVVSHQYSSTGTYNVKLVITDTANCKDSAIKSITVDTIPEFSLGTDTNLCIGDTMFLSGKPGYQTTWSTGSTAGSIPVESGGTYWARVQDVNNCYATDTIVINNLSPPTLDLGNDTSYCNGDTLTLSGPAGYTYLWSDSSTNQNYLITDTTDTFSLTIFDVNLCRDTDSIIVTIDTLPNPAVNGLTICEGQYDYLIAQNGATYSWTGGSSNDSLQVNPDTDSSYIVTVTDANGCEQVDTGQVTVTAVNNPAQKCDVPAIHAAMTSNGFIPLSGCEPVFNDCSMYYLNPEGLTPSQAQAEAQSLGVNLASVGSQAENDSILNWLQSAGATGVVWIGFNDIAVEGNFVWYDQSPVTYTNWAAGEPNNLGDEDCVQMLLGGGNAGEWNDLDCNSGGSQSIIEVNLCPQISVSPIDTTICKFDSVELDVGVILGSEPYSYNWQTGDTTQAITVSPTTATDYQFTVTDRYSCEAYDTVSVNLDTLPVVDLGNDTSICNLDSITLSADSGYTYLWQNGDTTQSIQAFDSSVVYWVEITDSNTCRGRDTLNLSLDTLPKIPIPNDTICANQAATIDAGGSTHKYRWNNGVIVQQLLTSLGGTYWVTRTDSNGCSAKDTMTLVVNQLPPIDLGADSTICAGDSYTVRLPGDFSYVWQDNSTDTFYTVSTTRKLLVTATDSNNCQRVDSISLTRVTNPIPDINSGADSVFFCEGNAVTLQTAHTYALQEWHSILNYIPSRDTIDTIFGNPIIGDTMALYHVYVTDSNNCTGVDSIFVFQDTIPIIDLGGSDTICNGDSVLLDAGPGYKIYQWSSGSRSQTDTIKTDGNYNVVLIDFNDCSASDLFRLVVDTLPEPYLGNDTSICSSDSISLYSSSAYTNVWSPNTPGTPDTVATIKTPGQYWVQATDANGCIGRDTMQLSNDTLPNVVMRSDTTICLGDSITVISSFHPTFTYTWTGSSSTTNTATVKQTGVYKLQIQDANQCIGLDSFELSHDTLPVVQFGPDTSICQGVSLILDAGPNYNSYQWNNNFTTQQIQVTTAGVYSVLVVDQNQCRGGDTIDVQIDPLPVPNLGADREYCFGTPIFEQLDPGPGYAVYDWSMPGATGQQVETVTSPGNYSVTVTDTNGCKAADFVRISANFRPVVDLPDTTFKYCANEEFRIVLDAGPSMKEYIWVDLLTGDTIAKSGQILLVDTHRHVKVTIVDFGNCTNADSVEIEELPVPDINLGSARRYCVGDFFADTIDSDPVGANPASWSYRWSTGEQTKRIVAREDGDYTVTITTADGCKDKFTKRIIEQPQPDVDLSDDTLVCEGSVNDIDVYNEGYQYMWINKWNPDDPDVDDTLYQIGEDPNIYDLTQPSYTVDTSAYIKVVVWDQVCWVADSNVLRLDTFPRVDFGLRRPDTTVCKGQVIVLNPSFYTTTSEIVNYEWQDGSKDSIYLASTTGQYSVNITNDCGSDVKSLYVSFEDCSQIWIPNTFTPNGDEDNETWGVSTLDEFIEFHLYVYDRYGHVVWESTNPDVQWDGTKNGVDMPGDLYSYVLVYRSRFEQVNYLSEEEQAPERVEKGVLHLVR